MIFPASSGCGGPIRISAPVPRPRGIAAATLVTVAATGWSLLAAVNLLWPGVGTADPDAALPAGFAGDRLTFELMVLVPLIVVAVVSVVFSRSRGHARPEPLSGSRSGP